MTSVLMVDPCHIADHGDCAEPAQANDNCAPEGFPSGLCHCIVSPQRLCIKTP